MRPIDADALERTLMFSEDAYNTLDEDELHFVISQIDDAPTIEVPQWIPFEIRPTDDEEREYFKTDIILAGKLPDEGDEILVSRGKWVWQDTFVRYELGAWLDSYGDIEDGMAWMPLPEPWKGADDDRI